MNKTISDSQNEKWTIQQALNWTANYFKQKKVHQAQLDAELLLAYVCSYERIELYTNFDKPLSLEERAEYKDLILKRVSGEPVAYLIETKPFWSLDLTVGPGVLIPRPDTEILVEVVIDLIRTQRLGQPLNLLELGVGSGAIPLALCSELENLNFICVDKSSKALSFAKLNYQRYQNLVESKNNHLTLIESDQFKQVESKLQFDYIISNPPYLTNKEIQTLEKDVKDFEPHMALDGGEDGLQFYEYLIQESESRLVEGGFLIVEIGFNQKESIIELHKKFKKISFIDSKKDLQNYDRVMIFQKQS